MPDNNLLDKNDIDPSLKAFAVSLSRYIAQDPEFLLELERIHKVDVDGLGWIGLYQDLQDEDVAKRFSKNLNEKAAAHDWSDVESSYRAWGEYGWIADGTIARFGFWDKCPSTQVEADKLVLSKINKKYLEETIVSIHEKRHNVAVFSEACKCFEHKCYTACASLLISLIDGELISSKANWNFENKKTGSNANKRIVTDVSKDDNYGMPGFFHLELLNYESFINTLFERANGFDNEPKRINRNYLHHGMSKRKVLRKDCIKLLLAYRRTLNFANRNTKEG